MTASAGSNCDRRKSPAPSSVTSTGTPGAAHTAPSLTVRRILGTGPGALCTASALPRLTCSTPCPTSVSATLTDCGPAGTATRSRRRNAQHILGRPSPGPPETGGFADRRRPRLEHLPPGSVCQVGAPVGGNQQHSAPLEAGSTASPTCLVHAFASQPGDQFAEATRAHPGEVGCRRRLGRRDHTSYTKIIPARPRAGGRVQAAMFPPGPDAKPRM